MMKSFGSIDDFYEQQTSPIFENRRINDHSFRRKKGSKILRWIIKLFGCCCI